MELTDMQKKAVNTDGKNILVSAAAGSGKTSVLSARIARLVSQHADIRRMLVCTFTNAAAAEMRGRIARRLSEAAEAEGNARLRVQAEYASSADICTIHSFCMKVIKENFLYLGLPGKLRTAGDALKNNLSDRAMEDTFEELAESGNESFLRLARRYSDKNDDGLKKMLADIYNYSMSLEEGIEWMNGIDGSSAFMQFTEMRGKRLRRLVQEMVWAYEDCLVVSERNGWDKQIENDGVELDSAEYIMDALEIGDAEVFSRAEAFVKKNRASKLLPPEENALHDKLKKNARELLGNIRKMSAWNADMMRGEQQYMSAQTADFYVVLKVFETKFSRLKTDRGLVTYDDIISFAAKALKNDDIADDYRNRYDYVFVDEYQDTNPVQDSLIARISRPGGRFMVGDIKQSIYRFRLADPLIFRKKQDEYDGRDSGVELIRMNENFRSSSGVTDAVNEAMTALMTREFGEIDYSAGEELIAKRDVDGGTELLLTETGDMKADERIYAEAASVADRLAELSREGRQWSDMAVLMGVAKKAASVFCEVFESRGIPAEKREQPDTPAEVELFINLLRLVDNMNSDTALLSVMRSLIGGFDETELAEIRTEHKKGSFYTALTGYEGRLGKKCADFLDSLKMLRIYSRSMELTEFLILLKNRTYFEETLCAMPDGEKRAASFMRFFDELIGEAAQCGGVHELLEYLDGIKKRNGSYVGKAEDSGAERDCVRIMTVHGSKGLEFPVVVFARLDQDINERDLSEKALYHSALGILTDMIDEKARTRQTGIMKELVRDMLRMQTRSEQLRLVYVAMTRAKERLILSGCVSSEKDATEAFTKRKAGERAYMSKKPLVWLGSAFGKNGSMSISVKTVRPEAAEAEGREKRSIEEILKRAAEIPPKGFLTYTPDRRPIKLSVSSLLPEYDELPYKGSGGGAELGTLVHLFMQHADFKRFEGVSAQLARMKKALLITQSESESILSFAPKIESFMQSDICARIAASDRIYRETPFDLLVDRAEIGAGEGSVLVQGIIDLMFEENGSVVIIDYKSNNASEDELGALTEHYGMQLKMYRRAVEEILGKRVSQCVLCYMRAGKSVLV